MLELNKPKTDAQRQQIWKNLKRAVLEQIIVIPPAIKKEDELLKELRKFSR